MTSLHIQNDGERMHRQDFYPALKNQDHKINLPGLINLTVLQMIET